MKLKGSPKTTLQALRKRTAEEAEGAEAKPRKRRRRRTDAMRQREQQIDPVRNDNVENARDSITVVTAERKHSILEWGVGVPHGNCFRVRSGS